MNFIKKGLLNVLLFGGGLVIVNGLSFAMLPFYTRQFSPAEFALITMALTFLPLTRYCLPLEICQAAPIFCADNPLESATFVSAGFWFTLTINIVCYLFIYFMNVFFHFIDLTSLNLLILLVFLAVDCLYYYSSNIVRWDLKSVYYNFVISAVAILEVVLIFIFILIFKLSILSIFYSWIICRAFGFFLMFYVSKKHYSIQFKFSALKKMLAFSFPLALSNIPYNFNRSFDRWLIATCLGLSAVGMYGAGLTMSGAISFIMSSFSAALTPIIYKNHERKEAPAEMVKLFFIVTSFCMAIALFMALFNNEIVGILISKKYHLENQTTVPILILTAIFSSLYFFSPGISIQKKTHQVIWCNIIALVVNITLSCALVFKWGLPGVALATCVSMLVNNIVYMSFSQKYYPLPFKLKHIVIMSSVYLLFYVGGIYLGMLNIPSFIDSLLIRILYCLIFGLAALFLVWNICKNLQQLRVGQIEASYNYV